MIFNELLYPVFLFACVLVFHILPVNRRCIWLFFTGFVFYAYYAQIFLLLILAEAFLVYFLFPSYAKNKTAFLVSLSCAAGFLFWFKYRGMFAFTAEELFKPFVANAHLSSFEKFVLPLAISFFTFEFIHYVMDAKSNKVQRHTLDEFLAFAMFFPTMVAGPIKRFQHFAPQVKEAKLSAENINAGIIRILMGYAKKMIIADTMDLWVQPLLSRAGISSAGTLDLWIALFAYSIKIYADFSGYSDIAIGSARLFGIVIPENFLLPYFKQNITLFWRNWHISLTSWLMDYVYIPLGGSRKGLFMTCVNIVLTFLVSGLWHGAAWHFVAWGLYHGILLACHRLYTSLTEGKNTGRKSSSFTVSLVSTGFTFVIVTLGWGLFIMPVNDFVFMLPKLFFTNGG